jgi:hypothetical protein
MFKIAGLGMVATWIMLCIICRDKLIARIKATFGNSRGVAGDDAGDKGGDKGVDKGLSQDAVNAIVQERLSREREKFKDYDDLVKFKSEHQKQVDAQTQKDLETRKEYDKAKEVYETKIKELSGVVSTKDQSILDMRVGYSLTNELSKANAYVEEATALLKTQVISQEGSLFIKGKDANNLDVNLTLEEGVKQFLAKRPHLVKAQARLGAGTTGAASGDGTAASGADDLMTLNEEYLKAHTSGDHKRARELKVKIQQVLTSKRVNRV